MRSYGKTYSFRQSRTDNDYVLSGNQWSRPYSITKSRLLEIFRLDYQIRLLAQREESLSYQAKASKKTTDIITSSIEDDTSMEETRTVTDFDSKISSARAQRLVHESTMFRLVTTLPSWLKELYYSLRHNPLWYMRDEMVHDCAGRGGCCSRGCGCCAQRSWSENIKARGHCTPECWCCKCFQDSSLTEKDQKAIALGLEKLLKTGVYICDMANWYFRPLSLRYKLMNSKKWKVKFWLKR